MIFQLTLVQLKKDFFNIQQYLMIKNNMKQ